MAKSDFKFAWPFRVRYSEVDGQMIVFNAHYLTYYDTAITEYFRALPYDYMGQVERTGEDYHTVRTLVEYQQPISFACPTSRLGRSISKCMSARRVPAKPIVNDLPLVEIHPKGQDDLACNRRSRLGKHRSDDPQIGRRSARAD